MLQLFIQAVSHVSPLLMSNNHSVLTVDTSIGALCRRVLIGACVCCGLSHQSSGVRCQQGVNTFGSLYQSDLTDEVVKFHTT